MERYRLPEAYLSTNSEGASVIEWTVGQRRLGINVEATPEQTGWYFISLDIPAPSPSSGSFDTFDPVAMFRALGLKPEDTAGEMSNSGRSDRNTGNTGIALIVRDGNASRVDAGPGL